MKLLGGLVTAMTLAGALAAGAPAPRGCDDLRSLALPHTTITTAEAVEAGRLTLPLPEPPPPPVAATIAALPAFCRVAATIQPTSDSDIRVEVWMPAAGWNGRFEGVGNGGWSGAISYAALATALRRGYAAASTDTGHAGGSGSFALGHPEKLVDFGWRAVHEMTVQGKAIVTAFYGKAPERAFWSGCSSGGKQGLKEAQRFPDDYDAVIAGAPANYWTHLMAGSIAIAQATLKEPASYIPRDKYKLIHQAVLDACDRLDGVKDGLIEDPTRCRFDPKVLQCPGDETPDCLTAAQVEAARKIYAPSKNPRSGAAVFPGLEPGSELGWGAMAGGPEPFAITADHFKYVVFKNPEWDFRTLDLDRDVALADKIDDGLLNATDPNLQPFFARGGRLLLYHGWSDQLIAPQNTVNYYRAVLAASGAKARDSIRLFMVPGMAHCRGGEGPDDFDALGAMEEWVEHARAPERIVAAHAADGRTDRTRPLCAYPRIAKYAGSGSVDDAANFVCEQP